MLFINEIYEFKNDPFFWGTFILTLIFIQLLVYIINIHNNLKEVSNNNLKEVSNNNLKEVSNNNLKETENNYEEDSEDDATTINSKYSETSDEVDESSSDHYISVLFKSFSLLTKKQLLKMIGRKYKNQNKDKLIVIAMYKFISNSVEHSDSLPKIVKLYVKENKHIMKEELLNQVNDKKE